MPSLDDLARRGAITVLAALGRTESMSMEEFTKAALLTESPAKTLREDLRMLKLIDVEESPVRGVSVRMRITLTPLGRTVARHLNIIDAALGGHSGPERRERTKSKT